MSEITFKHHVTAAVTGAALAVMIFATPVAHAEPAPIDDASGPRTVGAEPKDASGTPGPSFDEPVPIPGVGDQPTKPSNNATAEENAAYKKARAAYEAQVAARDRAVALEHARQAAKAYRECIARNNTNEVC